jgi:uncharacterized membrane protein
VLHQAFLSHYDNIDLEEGLSLGRIRMSMLLTAAIVFLAIHFLISWTRVRDSITRIIGEWPYIGLFSLASLAVIAWLWWAYNAAQAGGDDPVLYDPGHVRDIGIIAALVTPFYGA